MSIINIRRFFLFSIFSILFLITSFAKADDTSSRRHRWVGFDFSTGVPDGITMGVVVRPYVNWLRVEGAATYNGIAPGLKAGATWDMINFSVTPTLTAEYGHTFNGTIPGVDRSPTLNYGYFNLQPGLEFGNRNKFRIYLRSGLSWIHATGSNFNHTVDNSDPTLFVGDIHTNIRFAPNAKVGFSVYF